MKALSIQQPWAWLIVNGYKDIENRDWPTKFRGRFLVHAGKKFDEESYVMLCARGGIPLPARAAFERGGIVGEASVLGCVEESASEWFMGYYGFVLGAPKARAFIPCRGMLGFFEIPDDVAKEIEARALFAKAGAPICGCPVAKDARECKEIEQANSGAPGCVIVARNPNDVCECGCHSRRSDAQQR